MILLGMAIRSWDSASWRGTGYDELLYRRYVTLMDGGRQEYFVFQKDRTVRRYEMLLPDEKGPLTVEHRGLAAFPEIGEIYLRTQAVPSSQCELPPTRFTFIYTAWLWKELRFGELPPFSMKALEKDQRKERGEDYSQDAARQDPPLRALHDVTYFFSILTLLASGLLARRMAGPAAALGVTLLLACDPPLIHLSQHAMVDGFFAFWALLGVWTTWENLKQPNHRGWLLAHALAMAAMVMTKENSFFVYCALGATVLANRWLHFGTVTPKFLAVSVAGGALGVVALMAIFGPQNLINIYRTFVSQSQYVEDIKLVADGPWHRYLLDMLVVSPVVICLALGALFTLAPRRKELAFAFVFVGASYLIMCNVPYGQNLRFASIWDFPLRLAAVLMIFEIASRWRQHAVLLGAILVALAAAYDFRQYTIIATDPEPKMVLYELDTKSLLLPQKILKDRADEPNNPARR